MCTVFYLFFFIFIHFILFIYSGKVYFSVEKSTMEIQNIIIIIMVVVVITLYFVIDDFFPPPEAQTRVTDQDHLL